jgi:hypothetical protein
MGDSKRRKATMGEKYGQEERFLPWLPVTKSQSRQFMAITTRVSWIGIIVMIAIWVTIRFIGPALGWWQVQG